MKKDSVMWARQYSKRLISALLITWGIGAVIGAAYEFIRLFANPDTASMDSLYIYLAVPLSCGIPSYLIPNIFLNKEKVKQNYIPDYDQTILSGEYDNEDGFGLAVNETENAVENGFYTDTETISAQPGDTDISDI